MTPTSQPPRVSIVIPAFNEESAIEGCLAGVLSQSAPAWEVIVVDNRSTDRTAEIVRRAARQHPGANIRVIPQFDEQGIVPTRNAGFAAATGDVLGRIDADTVISRDWVAQVTSAMADRSTGAVSGPVYYYDLPFRGADRMSDDLARRLLRRLGKEYPFLFGSNMAIRADAWRQIQHDACLDRGDVLHEDIDLSIHLHDAEIPVTYQRRMRASVSARRLSTSRASFRAYTHRFDRTYRAHRIEHWHLKAPRILLTAVYWWTNALRSLTPPLAAGVSRALPA